MWLGTDKVFDAFKFYIAETPYGVMQVHGYPFDASGSTFIAEMHEAVWRAAGFDSFAAQEFAPGESDEQSIERIEELFADVLDGHEVMANNSRWINFTTVRNRHWRHENVVLLGDAAHTAHFSIGSGTKLAMEDALSLAACLHEHSSVDAALRGYEGERRAVVLSTQRAAQASLEWFENLGQYVHQDPEQFAFNIMTRSRRVTYENLQLRDPSSSTASTTGSPGRTHPARASRPRVSRRCSSCSGSESSSWSTGSSSRPWTCTARPTGCRTTSTSSTWWQALGGRTGDDRDGCVSDTGRITPGCTGIWNDDQAMAWRSIAALVHAESAAKVGIQIGHSGRKGSTKLMWEGVDQPLDEGNWEPVGPSPLPYEHGVNQVGGRRLERRQRGDFTQVGKMLEREAHLRQRRLVISHQRTPAATVPPVVVHLRDQPARRQYGGDLAGRLATRWRSSGRCVPSGGRGR
jgi:anthraniloyl-CoA monooxygenase